MAEATHFGGKGQWLWQVLAKSKSVPATEPQWQALQVASTCGSPLEQRTAPGYIHCPSARCYLGAYCVRENCSNGLIPAGLLAGMPATCRSRVMLFVCAASRHQNSDRSGCTHSSSSPPSPPSSAAAAVAIAFDLLSKKASRCRVGNDF